MLADSRHLVNEMKIYVKEVRGYQVFVPKMATRWSSILLQKQARVQGAHVDCIVHM
jgi:hypothetical protein